MEDLRENFTRVRSGGRASMPYACSYVRQDTQQSQVKIEGRLEGMIEGEEYEAWRKAKLLCWKLKAGGGGGIRKQVARIGV